MAIYPGLIDSSNGTVQIGGKWCQELVAGYEESAGSQGVELAKSYLCNWGERFAVANAMLGLTSVSGGAGGTTAFARPFPHPEVPNAYGRDIRITGKGRPSAGPVNLQFVLAEIRVRFVVPEWNVLPYPGGYDNIGPESFVYATQDITQGEESVEIPGSALNYRKAVSDNPSGPGLAVTRSMSVPYAHAVLSITFHKLPYIPVATLPVYNNVNAGTFLGCARGKVKFKGSSVHREQSNDIQGNQNVTQEVTNVYHYRPLYDWNRIPNPNGVDADWGYLVYKADNARYLFPYTDLSVTFPGGYLS